MPILKLFELAGSDPNRKFSPFAWRTRMALAHKKLAFESIPWRFLDKDAISASGQTKVPVLVDGNQWIFDSWKIANYLEDLYPNTPSLFGGNSARGLSVFYNHLADGIVSQIFSFVADDIPNILEEKDREYFVRTREEFLGQSLTEFASNKAARLPKFRENLNLLRKTLTNQEYLAGNSPLYPDYAIFGAFQWARSVSTFVLLEKNDPINTWLDRLLNMYEEEINKSPRFY